MYEKARYNANTIAKEIIKYSANQGLEISNLKLQKMLYFVQAAFLTQLNRACFTDAIEAWEFGPVVPSVYRKYKIFGANSIPMRALSKNNFISLFSYSPNEKQQSILTEDVSLIHKVVDSLGKYPASKLVELTHAQSPWITSYVKHCNNEIPNESILAYFTDQRR